MIVRGAWNHLLRPGLRKDFRDSYQSFPEEYGMFLNVGNMDRAEVERAAISGIGRMARKDEVGSITYVDPVMSDKYTYVDDEWAIGFMISRRMMEDDQYGKSRQNAKWLGRAARLTQEYLAAALLDDAFDGSVFTGIDDNMLIDTDHALLNSSSTWSNEVSGNPSLSVSSWQAALELAEAQVDHQGDPMPMQPKRLLIDRTDEWMAIQLTKNTNEPDTTDRNINAGLSKSRISGYSLLHYTTVDGSWFVQDPSLSDMHFLFKVRPQMGDEMDNGGTLAARYWGRQRLLVYFFDPRGIIGSDGTGS
jgi:hypothetical protein